MSAVRDTLTVFSRAMRLSTREPVWVVFGLIQPLLYLLLFGPLLSNISASPGFDSTNSWKIFVPGLLVALTASALPEELAECRKAGMDDCLTKPLVRAKLEEVLERYLSKQRKPVGS